MKRLSIILLLFFLAVLLGLMVYADPGYVLVNYRNWSVESTLWVMIFCILLLFGIVYFLLSTIKLFFHGAEFFISWFGGFRVRRARKQTRVGLYAWLKGQFDQAEKMLQKGAKKSDFPLINYMFAARSAQIMRKCYERDIYLQEGQKIGGDFCLEVDLTKAELLSDSEKPEQALEILKKYVQAKKSVGFLLLLETILKKLQDWQSLKELLPEMYKNKVYSLQDLKTLECDIYLKLLNNFNRENDKNSADKLWHEISSEFKENEFVLAKYADVLLANGDDASAEKIIRHVLQRKWSELLIEKYSFIKGPNAIKQLAFAESFLPDHKQCAVLFLSLGRICKYQKLWGKSQSYLETSLSIKESNSVKCELAGLMESLGKSDLALSYYKSVAISSLKID